MMSLDIQLITFFYSLIYGVFSFLIISLLSKKNNVLLILFNLFVLLFLACVYFFILIKLNNGIIHPYYLFGLVMGFLIFYYIVNKFKK